ncbi:ABC transporter ATP-binding protein [Paenibacillus dokdonensis]|uniref:ABC transporter ATP-binding protein n=1 Tax=Paenibacillus dokdonensis TaxID=2567944 RepID=A0ABU6GMV0_9BACL|nr:ABC transporter ATP-binding protein [Paenibacillus dokdonensis]MEC0240432.1 ABC transporter ATP-binding protein [Paenibacillus dokdonensis]
MAIAGMEKGASAELVIMQDAVKVYGRRKVLHDISLKVWKGECIALVGKNGSGKSTLLRMLAGLTRPTSGTRWVSGGRLVTGYVPERFPPLTFTPWEFLLSSAEVRGMEKASAENELRGFLSKLGMESFAHVRMSQFSKGMLQKINLIQAMMGGPDLLLLDEPLSGLDIKAQENLLSILVGLKRGGTAIVMSVHEPTLIEQIADRVLLMKNGQIIEETLEKHLVTGTTTQIVLRGLDSSAVKRISEHPGMVDLAIRSDRCELVVRSEAVDLLIRQILDSGGSIVSVIPTMGMNIPLGEWLQPAASEKGDQV